MEPPPPPTRKKLRRQKESTATASKPEPVQPSNSVTATATKPQPAPAPSSQVPADAGISAGRRGELDQLAAPSPPSFTFQELGENISEGDLVRLMIAPGAKKVSEGQPVMELETDKAVVEVPSVGQLAW